MRLRKVKNALEKLSSRPDVVIQNPKEYQGKWNSIFPLKQEIRVEIGCGKGRFIIGMAKAFPNINFIAFEKFDSVLLRSLELYEEEELPNVRFVLADASNFSEFFSKGEVTTIYLNFSDPWPKARHAKRRLTSPLFLEQYKNVLLDDGRIIQKTDNVLLYDYSLESYKENGFEIVKSSRDLHKENWFNVMTEFEEKWSKLGPIYYAEVKIKNE